MLRARFLCLSTIVGAACAGPSPQRPETVASHDACPAPRAREHVLACTPGPAPTRAAYDAALKEMESMQWRYGVVSFKYARMATGQSPYPRGLLEAERQFLEIARAARCRGLTDDDGPKPLSREALEYKIGSVYYDASHWDEAAVMLDVVVQSGKGDERSYAAQDVILALEALDRIGRVECEEESRRRAAAYRTIFCAPATTDTGTLCRNLQSSIERPSMR